MPEPAPEVRSNDKGLISGRREEYGNRFEYGAPRRTAVQTIFSLISGIAVLAICGVTIYFMLMGNMFAYEGTPINPLTMSPADGSFGLVYNLEEIIIFFRNISTNFAPDDLAGMVPYIVQILLIVIYALAAVILSISTFIAVFAFIIGMARGGIGEPQLGKRGLHLVRSVADGPRPLRKLVAHRLVGKKGLGILREQRLAPGGLVAHATSLRPLHPGKHREQRGLAAPV